MNKLIAGALILLAAGCSAYRPATDQAVDVRSDARACQLATFNPVAAIFPIAALATAPDQFNSMDSCMARKGWVRK